MNCLTPDGDEIDIDFDVEVAVTAHRLIWVSDYELWGGQFFADFLIPLQNTNLDIGALGVSEDDTSIGDIFLEPFGLAWHGDKYDLAFALSVFLPSADFDIDDPVTPGRGFWTGMVSFGGTQYFGENKSWAASLLARYEIHGEQDDTDITPGDDFHFEWGISKVLPNFWEVGFGGYVQQQVSSDDGPNLTPALEEKDRAIALGPEVTKFISKLEFVVKF